MAIQSYVTVSWEQSPRIIWIDTTTSTSISVQDLIDTCSSLHAQPANMDDDILLESSGKEYLTADGSVKVGLTVTLHNAKIAFKSLGGPEWILCSIEGGNVVAVESIYDTPRTYIDVIYPTAYITVERVSSSSATLSEQAAIQYASFNGGVTVDVTSSYSGTDYPIGTPQQPVNNFIDALSIAAERGFPKFFVIGDATVDTGATDYTAMEFIGESRTKTTLTVETAAIVTRCEFYTAYVQGTLDGNSRLKDCMVGDLNYINGFIENCVLDNKTITLGGGAAAQFIDCKAGVDGTNVPTIDMGGSGQALGIRNYNGTIKITNKSGSDEISIDMNSGEVILDNTVTAGLITVRGIAHLTDNSNGATVVSDDLLDGHDIISLDDKIDRTLGLMHENIYIDQPSYDVDDNLVSARVRIYSDSASVGTDNNVIETYIISSGGAGINRFTYWKQVKQ